MYEAGNYKSFGDTKFIPRLPKEVFVQIVKAIGSPEAIELFFSIKDSVYSCEPEESLLIGHVEKGHVSGYYSKTVTQLEIEKVHELLSKHGISSLNTRLFKPSPNVLQVRVASAFDKPPLHFEMDPYQVQVVFGDFQSCMAKAAVYMQEALKYVANDTQKAMVEAYIESFQTGSMEAHRTSQKHWIKDKGPVVESCIGFIETYRDPAGVRAYWEGFVAVVNKEMSLKFEKLVNGAPDFIPMLPWGPAFEKDVYDFRFIV